METLSQSLETQPEAPSVLWTPRMVSAFKFQVDSKVQSSEAGEAKRTGNNKARERLATEGE